MILSVENAAFHYPNRRPLFENLSFELATPSVMSVLGANGAGKTTLLKCILGFEKWSQGSVLLDRADAAHMSSQRFWQRIAYVPQAKSAPFSYTVEETVLLGRSSRVALFGKPSAHDLEVAHRSIEFVGVQHLLNQSFSQLSVGPYQMVLIARALAADPELLVMDLDFKNQLKVLSCIRDLRQRGVGCLINTHYPAHALEISDQALVMLPGQRFVFGKTEEVLTAETLTEAFGVEVTIFKTQLADGRIVSNVTAVSA